MRNDAEGSKYDLFRIKSASEAIIWRLFTQYFISLRIRELGRWWWRNYKLIKRSCV